MIWAQNNRGDKIGVLNWTIARITGCTSNQLSDDIRMAANRCRDEGARSLCIVIETGPLEAEPDLPELPLGT